MRVFFLADLHGDSYPFPHHQGPTLVSVYIITGQQIDIIHYVYRLHEYTVLIYQPE